ncbi:hypothetical protein ACFPAF_14720 [Hymenobacter endophyticus]|uniref:DUF2721 domain-containing protein n=2 Tax=Hymenobacter endophyticus TaxID=3076335 RepID=A0ABU3TKB5_9BACT|nr:hypothetical protein [Hymenobacter endophyticus]
MLANQADTPVSAMLRNTKKEQRILLFVLVLNVGNIANLTTRYLGQKSFVGQLLLFTCVGLMVSFTAWTTYRKRQLIAQLQTSDTSTYSHLSHSIRQIRLLLRNKTYAGMVFLATIILSVFFVRFQDMLTAARTGTLDWGTAVLVVLAIVALFVGLLYQEKYMQQKKYGRHLDQLEAALRELETVE